MVEVCKRGELIFCVEPKENCIIFWYLNNANMSFYEDTTEIEEQLNPSELGTKEYWQSVYERDKDNFLDHGDVGDIWFGEDSELRVIRWLEKRDNCHDKKIIDLGCGNGMMLIELAREGFQNLTGVDYCENAIELAKIVFNSQSMNNIVLKVADLTLDCIELHGYDIALDKGTYDAISLSPEDALTKRRNYIQNVFNLLLPKGLFIITSCNWTQHEIVKHFTPDFAHIFTIPTPMFKFGGKVGNLVSTIILEKVSH